MGSNRQRTETYTEQLNKWITKSGWKKGEIASLAHYFQFDDDLDESDLDDPRRVRMQNSTLSYLLKNRPSHRPGRYNLYAILGVLYALDVINKTDIENFLSKFGYDKEFPEDLTWTKIWNVIETGAKQCRENEHLSSPPMPQPIKNSKLAPLQLTKIWIIIGSSIFSIVVIIAIILLFQQTKSTSENCQDPVAWMPPPHIMLL